MIAVTDTSPLCYLVLVGEIGLLSELFERTLVPSAVISELGHPNAPGPVRDWLAAAGPQFEIRSATSASPAELAPLDSGEQEVIRLSLELGGVLAILDDKAARIAAKRLNLPVVGTLGILQEGAKRGLVNIKDVVERLRRTNFRASPALLDELVRRNS